MALCVCRAMGWKLSLISMRFIFCSLYQVSVVYHEYCLYKLLYGWLDLEFMVFCKSGA
jgi:hypothetical protein